MTQKPIFPTPAQLQLLSPFERMTFKLADFVNSNPQAKQVTHYYLKTFGAQWVYYCTRNLMHILGLENIRHLSPPRGLLLVSNHRSLFDQYVISCWLFHTTSLLKRLYFPVRSEFFYEKPLGVFVSFIMSALAMYPPIFRTPKKRAFNTYSVERLIEILKTPGAVVGVHPEGTRNKGDDPYTLLKAQPGVGKLILEAQPTVVPAFINGLSNDFVQQVKRNFTKPLEPVVVVIGKPLDLSPFYAKPKKLRTQKEVADAVLGEIAKLGGFEREYRAKQLTRPIRGPILV